MGFTRVAIGAREILSLQAAFRCLHSASFKPAGKTAELRSPSSNPSSADGDAAEEWSTGILGKSFGRQCILAASNDQQKGGRRCLHLLF